MSQLRIRRAAVAASTFAFLLLPCGTGFADDHGYAGLLRARDLSPFGFLRLDMRPAHADTGEPGTWSIETELAYQNTWALSPAVERYLEALPGTRELGPAEFAAIRALPGENYLVDLELAQLDVTLHHKFSRDWAAYAVLSGATYQGGFMDHGIEGFHNAFGFSTFGRPAVKRDDVNVLFDLKSVRSAVFERPIDGGLLDPTLGVRYAGFRVPRSWRLLAEAAVKLPVGGYRPYLSNGRSDVGLQVSLQRFSVNHAFYLSASAVHYDGSRDSPRTKKQLVPTLVAGFEKRVSGNTHVILQAYGSKSVYSRNETDLSALRKNKYQLSLGTYHRRGRGLFSFAFTENLQNLNNTPDIGFQLGWVYNPVQKPR